MKENLLLIEFIDTLRIKAYLLLIEIKVTLIMKADLPLSGMVIYPVYEDRLTSE